ncbi:MAG: hypothetical protein HY518_01760 [Candidatus Aenigmarchaeota archaeon]|nr:hypothetical protein [Candidatus Aenigmarchaeota archaeon]
MKETIVAAAVLISLAVVLSGAIAMPGVTGEKQGKGDGLEITGQKMGIGFSEGGDLEIEVEELENEIEIEVEKERESFSSNRTNEAKINRSRERIEDAQGAVEELEDMLSDLPGNGSGTPVNVTCSATGDVTGMTAQQVRLAFSGLAACKDLRTGGTDSFAVRVENTGNETAEDVWIDISASGAALSTATSPSMISPTITSSVGTASPAGTRCGPITLAAGASDASCTSSATYTTQGNKTIRADVNWTINITTTINATNTTNATTFTNITSYSDSLLADVKVIDTSSSTGNATGRVELATHLLNQAKKKLANAEEAFEDGDFGEAFGQATAAWRLAINGKRVLFGEPQIVDKTEILRKFEIKVKIDREEGEAKIRIKTGTGKQEFTLGTTDRTEILEKISENTGISVEDLLENARIKESEDKVKIRIPGRPEMKAKGFAIAPGRARIRIEEDKGEGSVVTTIDARGTIQVTVAADKTVTIEQGETRITIKDGQVSAETEGQVEYDGENLLIEKAGRKGKVAVLPEKASEAARTGGRFSNLKAMDLDVSGEGRVVYLVKGVQKGKLLGLLDTELEGDAEIDATTGSVLKVNKPFWAFLVF